MIRPGPVPVENRVRRTGDDSADCLVGGDSGERLGRPRVTVGERATSLLGQLAGDSAAGGQVTGEDLGEQLKALWMVAGAVCGRGVDQPGPPQGTGGAGATTRESSIMTTLRWKRTVLGCSVVRTAICATSSGFCCRVQIQDMTRLAQAGQRESCGAHRRVGGPRRADKVLRLQLGLSYKPRRRTVVVAELTGAQVDRAFERRTEPTRALGQDAEAVGRACYDMALRFHRGGRLLCFGNGSAAADAAHTW